MIGFAPGFPYLGGMYEKIATPRKESPRLKIPARSVGIAGNQTGIYPIETPGGWQIIGRTPIELFKPKENPPSLLKAGDRIRFNAINLEEYKILEAGMEMIKIIKSGLSNQYPRYRKNRISKIRSNYKWCDGFICSSDSQHPGWK